MLGTKLIKGNFIQQEYSDMAMWCNNNNAHIEDKREFYEVVENPIHIPPVEEVVENYVKAVQNHLDAIAQTRNYDNILSLCTYATSTNEKFRREGQAGVKWRDAVWSKCYEILEEIQAGNREIPEDIISELPVMNWGD